VAHDRRPNGQPTGQPKEQTGARPVGRPRDPAVQRAIVDATLELLNEDGWRRLSIERIAARAGVAATTVYRRYASVEEVMLGLVRDTFTAVRLPDTGNIRDDLVAMMRDVVAAVGPRRSLMAALVAAMDEHPSVDAAFREIRLRRRAETVPVIERAVARGEVRPDVDPHLVLDTITGLVDRRVLFWRTGPQPEIAEQVVDLVLPGILVSAPR
jgi:AcrR family transcriptional regulator